MPMKIIEAANGAFRPKEQGQDLTSAVGLYRDVVKIAMKRVREGAIDSENKQILYLISQKFILKVMDADVREGFGGTSSVGPLSDGLYITATDFRTGMDYSIMLPRKVQEVGNRHLKQFGADREKLEDLIFSLKEGFSADEEHYLDSCSLANSRKQAISITH